MFDALVQNLLAISRQIDAFLNGHTPDDEDCDRLLADFEDAVAELSDAMASPGGGQAVIA
jgi:hypothetical protein